LTNVSQVDPGEWIERGRAHRDRIGSALRGIKRGIRRRLNNPADMLPFTREEFLGVFVAYNEAVWPVQWVAYAVGVAVVALVLRSGAAASRVACALVGAMWLWTGIGYHAMHFSDINVAAWGFAVLFVAQAGLWFEAGLVHGRIMLAPVRGARGWLGWALIAYAAVAYPLLGLASGHRYPALPMFGITPCPLTIFTFGVLLLTVAPVPRRMLVIPFAWSLVGGSAALLLAVPQDWLLLASGASVLLLGRGAPPLEGRRVH
jgi:hypothetical protein